MKAVLKNGKEIEFDTDVKGLAKIFLGMSKAGDKRAVLFLPKNGGGSIIINTDEILMFDTEYEMHDILDAMDELDRIKLVEQAGQ